MDKRVCAVIIGLLLVAPLTSCGAAEETDGIRPVSSATPSAEAEALVTSAECRGRIAFVGRTDSEKDIFVINADGGGLINVTNGAGPEASPAWSPDGTRIVFTRHVGNSDVYTIRPDGSGLVRLTDLPSREYAPAWSPDGRYVLFGSTSGNASEILVVGAEGGEAVPLTESGLHKPDLAWSPDGSHIAFTMLDGYNQGDVFVMAAPEEMRTDGSGATNLTQHPAHDCCISWAPDSERVLFLSSRGDKDTQARLGGRSNVNQSTGLLIRSAPRDFLANSPDETRPRTTVVPKTPQGIYVIDTAGGNLTRLTNGEGKARHATWSPDGERIAFVSDRDGNAEIYVMSVAAGSQADNSTFIRLTNSPKEDRYPTWSPDGRCLAFISYSGGKAALYATNADGGEPTKLADNVDRDSRPSWTP